MGNLEEMDKFLEMYTLPNPKQEEIENLNRLASGLSILLILSKNQLLVSLICSTGFMVQ